MNRLKNSCYASAIMALNYALFHFPSCSVICHYVCLNVRNRDCCFFSFLLPVIYLFTMFLGFRGLEVLDALFNVLDCISIPLYLFTMAKKILSLILILDIT